MITYPNVKINLGLHVLRKRADGFHDLETLFVPYFGMSDVLEIVEAPQASIELVGGSWNPESDLSWKAYQMLREEFGLPGVKIRLTKRNPVGAGLGGGSADAAFTLRMLSEMFSLALPDEALAAYAARLGSDCAFFIYNTPMLGEGRGEVLTPFPLDLGNYELRVEIPQGSSVSTKEAYSGVKPRFAPGTSGPGDLREILSLPVEQWKGALVNDFEASVFPLHPEIAALKEKMYADGAVYAAMSGSGSAVFGLFR